MPTLVECVPNFSEGRDKAKVDAILEAMKMDGVYLLDREMDADHNRCVITSVGDREPMMEAVLRGVGKAAELIDLTKHTGAHPRMGATDVVPFIPIEGVTIEDCVQMAKQVGEQIWKRFQIPVYLYEAAAQRPERTNLENIRRGQFEGIRDEIATNPARMPDFGEPRVHPTAGATVVGARKFLVAYNVYLNTPDVGSREEGRQGRALLQWRLAFRERNGYPRARTRAGFHEPDRHRPDADRARLRIREEGSRALRRDAALERDCRTHPQEVAGRCSRMVPAGRELSIRR